jgi:hypothetical protein
MEASGETVFDKGDGQPELEVVGWTGERRRGGFAVADSSGSGAKGTGWIFGPSQITPGEPRVQVNLGKGFSIDFAAPFATWLLGRVLAESDEDRRTPMDGRARPITPESIRIAIDGVLVAFALARHGQSWLAEGAYQGWAVEISGTSIDAASLRLRRVAATPEDAARHWGVEKMGLANPQVECSPEGDAGDGVFLCRVAAPQGVVRVVRLDNGLYEGTEGAYFSDRPQGL